MTSEEQKWLESFPDLCVDTVYAQFLLLLGNAWDANKNTFTVETKEDAITRRLVGWMIKEIRANYQSRGIRWSVSPQKDVLGSTNVDSELVGRTDMVITLPANRDFIVECKRLWAKATSIRKTFSTSARLYIKEGLNRFLFPAENQKPDEPQYSDCFGHAGMVGYVMNGTVQRAEEAVGRALNHYAPPLPMQTTPPLQCPTQGSKHFVSVHKNCADRTIHVHHVLLPLFEE